MISSSKSCYLAIHADSFSNCSTEQQLELMLNLTPKVMAWGPGIWLLDMGVCQSYWQVRATSLHTDVTSLWRSLLHQLLVPGAQPLMTGSYIGASTPYYAALSDQPWTAILLLNYLRERSIRGFIDIDSSFGHNLNRDISWSSWWTSVEQIGPHFAAIYKSFDQIAYQQACTKMQKSMDQLSSKKPWDMRTADAASIKRRFGGWLSHLWSWCRLQQSKPAGLFDDASAFPWLSTVQPVLPHLSRHLDTPVVEWDHLALVLQDDLNRLCALRCWDIDDRVNEIEWVLILDDMSVRETKISFRHPHNLHSQCPEQKTALTQANYSFERNVQESPLSSPIVGWKLQITGRLRISTHLGTLFDRAANQSLENLLELENQLPMALEAYELKPDWNPEDSFALTNTADLHTQRPKLGGTERDSFLALATHRPLYLFKTPQPLDRQMILEQEMFLEKTSQKWWQPQTRLADNNLQRCYYRLRIKTGQRVWAYQDAQENWLMHGIFA